MLRRARGLRVEAPSLELLAGASRDAFRLYAARRAASAAPASGASQTVRVRDTSCPEASALPPAPPPPPRPPAAPPAPTPRRSWQYAAAAAATLALSSVGVLLYRRRSPASPAAGPSGPPAAEGAAPAPVPSSAEALPAHVHFLLVGAGTASFAALRAIRSAQPSARVLLVGDEPTPPYMRPPLSKELWREPRLADAAARPDTLTFRQWNGKRRALLYEPPAFYAPVERLAEADGAAVARGWRVTGLDPVAHHARLQAVGAPDTRATLTYDKCLIATGVRAARVPALQAVGARSLPLRTVEDVRRLAARLDAPDTRHVAVIGGGFLATELAAALAERLADRGARVTQVYREEACLAHVLPRYLALEAARRVRDAGAHTLADSEVTGAALVSAEGGGERVRLRLSSGERLDVDLVVEAVGSEPNTELAEASRLELHPALGGVLVNAELAARTDHYAAGDVACFYDEALGRRRVEHHDHAVLSGRLAGENMAGARPPRPYTHQSMLWSDLGPDLGYEAIGIVDSRLPTFGVFAASEGADAVVAEPAPEPEPQPERAAEAERAQRPLSRGVVFYLRERRVVGVLLWNLFNRMHVARQVLAVGEFEDLGEVAKLFALHAPPEDEEPEPEPAAQQAEAR